MASRHERIAASLPGFIVAGTIGLLLIAIFAKLLTAVDAKALGVALEDPYLWRVLRFTLLQAGLSVLVSVVPGVALARAIARRPDFLGRKILLRLLGLPTVVPVVVAVFGIVAVFGQTGIANRALESMGIDQRNFLYGLPGILIGHAFFNLPLAARLLLPAWTNVPGETWRLATQLGMGPLAIFRLIEWPLLRERLPGVTVIVFLLCMTSFAVVLTLGGGPASTTVEVAIYQALRFDYDPSRAALLALLQLGISAAAIIASQQWSRSLDLFATAGRVAERPDRKGVAGQLFDFSAISLAAVFLLTPLGAIVLAGLQPAALGIWINPNVWAAAGRSLGIATLAGVSAVLAALALQLAIRSLYRHRRSKTARTIDLSGSIVLGLSPLAFGAGLFLLLVGIVGPFRWSLAPVVLLSAFLALPFAMRLLGPPLMHSDQLYRRLCESLGVAGWTRWRWVDWPMLQPSLGFALALAVTLSVGDLASIALFGTPDNATLPLLVYQLMGNYRMAEAAGVSLFFVLLVIALFMGTERVIGGRYAARN